ncbi:hypothetical protein [Amycolatopsis sp. CA-230715]|uniref:hypothetical protein n=1 Tax=Amycolatopsis sp. CA-230715 TaxID=2745196 RepID=UPI001C01F3FA|nr:hypothetical protein [Amycolatopsis sp. CA-230715]QWF81857.1 hypothetical protein HUW46_05290 [Amycolatopsis sp. CA-230715]
MGSTTMKSMKVALVGGAVAAAALLSACSGNGAAGNNSAAPVKNVADTAAFKGTTQGNHAPAKGNAANKAGGTTNDDVNCSDLGGKVGLPGGPQVDLLAVASPDGTTGCTEAFNVITEYYEKVPTEGEGPGQKVIDITGGWDCAKAEEPAGSQGAVYCGKGATALRIETKPSQNSSPASPPKLRFPNTTQTVQFAGFDNSTNMAQFKLMKWKSGGPDGGHYVEVPGDTKTYRLPLHEHGEVYSAATICSNDSVTVDDRGFGTTPCTPEQLTEALSGGNPVLAQIHVDGDDRIATVKEIYHP